MKPPYLPEIANLRWYPGGGAFHARANKHWWELWDLAKRSLMAIGFGVERIPGRGRHWRVVFVPGITSDIARSVIASIEQERLEIELKRRGEEGTTRARENALDMMAMAEIEF